jgi:large repetitive protein
MSMKNFSNQFNSREADKLPVKYWFDPLQWPRLLILVLTRIRRKIVENLFHNREERAMKIITVKSITQYQIISYTKTKIMKLQKLLIKCCMALLLFFSGTNAMAQAPYPKTGDHLVCLNSTEPYGVVLNAGSTYAWSITPLAGGSGTIATGQGTNTITVNWTSPGTATLQVIETNATGCSGDPVSIIVTINPLPTVTVNSPAICSGTSATITATPGAAGTYNYVWTVPAGATNPGNVATFTSGIAGTYSVVITNTVTGCGSASASGTVTISAGPNLVITNSAPVCGTGKVDLTAAAITAGSTAGLTFTYWTDAAATTAYATPTAATAGTYYIKGTLAGGCFDIKPIVVATAPAPTVVITNPASVCGTVDITAAAITAGSTPGLTFTYWTDAAATISYATPAIATAGTYYIKGTLASGCFDIKPVVVTTTAPPALVITNPAAICALATGTTTVDITAGAVTAGSTPGLTLTYWTDAAATVPYTTPTAATNGTYNIKGTLPGGCFDIKPVTVTINPLPTPVITGPTPVCVSVAGTTSTYTTPNVAGHTYNWTVTGGTIATGQGTNTITVTWTTAGAGSVNVTETITATGCTKAAAPLAVTVNPKPVTTPITHN